jgi:hypothetical protein
MKRCLLLSQSPPFLFYPAINAASPWLGDLVRPPADVGLVLWNSPAG